ncbi:DNA repair protein RecN [Hydrogenothermus marinus]|uniref:DNA repair protein RecN n=1 Tax=Hydrogenothermus marinus TaxID=133270 RepID=A0A3M0BSW5_9AQUI|nr:DNA repair protein RecN [Hydrogenothermus marinus]RMB00272.1 DNA replication and repair protein RecN [Hydrogenothermus marinus]
MLKIINIKKFLYLENIQIELDRGLNVFTGETGVGKSLIIDAIEFTLGKKFKDNTDTFVELVFENIENEYSEDGMLIIARQIKNNKSYYFLNGRRATLSTIKEAVNNILEIHGQHTQQMLFDKIYPLKVLDSFANIEDLVKEYQKIYKKYKSLEKAEKELSQKQSDRLKEIDIINFQIEELEKAEIQEGEKENLEKRYEYLSNIEDLKNATQFSKYTLLEEEGSIEEKLSSVIKELSKFEDTNENIKNAYKLLEDAKEYIKEAYYNLDSIDFDYSEEELYHIEERLNLLNRLELKYNTDEKGLITLKKQLKKRLAELNNIEFEIPKIKKEKQQTYKKLNEIAEKISKIRKEKAKQLDNLVENHLKELALKDAKFITKVEETDFNSYGKDKISFLFSANQGIKPSPINETASGGELSRVSLVLKLVSNKSSNTIIFDEIDTGIGGKTAIYMADKIKKLADKSKDYQVILITHLPQIAVVADTHYLIDKKSLNGKTIATVKKVENEEREKEIARMLSGIINEKSIQHARELLNRK